MLSKKQPEKRCNQHQLKAITVYPTKYGPKAEPDRENWN